MQFETTETSSWDQILTTKDSPSKISQDKVQKETKHYHEENVEQDTIGIEHCALHSSHMIEERTKDPALFRVNENVDNNTKELSEFSELPIKNKQLIINNCRSLSKIENNNNHSKSDLDINVSHFPVQTHFVDTFSGYSHHCSWMPHYQSLPPSSRKSSSSYTAPPQLFKQAPYRSLSLPVSTRKPKSYRDFLLQDLWATLPNFNKSLQNSSFPRENSSEVKLIVPDTSIFPSENYTCSNNNSNCAENQATNISQVSQNGDSRLPSCPETNNQTTTCKCTAFKICFFVMLLVTICSLVAVACVIVLSRNTINNQTDFPSSPYVNAPNSSNNSIEAYFDVLTRQRQVSYCGKFPSKYILKTSDSRSPEISPSSDEDHVNFDEDTSSSNVVYPVPYEEALFDTKPVVNKNTTRSSVQPKVLIRRPRVVGGSSLPAGIFSWQVSLWVKVSDDLMEAICGGSIILKGWVLTAAHCTSKRKAKNLFVYAGMSSLAEKGNPPAENRQVIQIIQHEKYVNDMRYHNDISLLKLEHDFIYSEFVQPICAPPQISLFTSNLPCYVSGWGLTNHERGANDPVFLKYARINIFNTHFCNVTLNGMVSEGMMCAGLLQGGKDACEGDSGGPLSCYIAEEDIWVIAGIVSWGNGCGRPNSPGVYTQVNHFSDWIWKHIGYFASSFIQDG